MVDAGSIGNRKPTDVINDYLDEKLSSKEAAQFEELVRKDADLAEKVRLQRKINYVIDHPDLQKDIELINRAKRNVELETLEEESTQSPMILAVATACLFLFCLIILLF